MYYIKKKVYLRAYERKYLHMGGTASEGQVELGPHLSYRASLV